MFGLQEIIPQSERFTVRHLFLRTTSMYFWFGLN